LVGRVLRRRPGQAKDEEAPEQSRVGDLLAPLPVEPAAAQADSDQVLARVLVERGILSPAQLQEAALQQPASGKPLRSLLTELGMAHEWQIATFLAEAAGLKTVDLRRADPDPNLSALVPEDLARTYCALAVDLNDGVAVVAIADPFDQAAVDAIRLGMMPRPVGFEVAPESDIRRALEHAYRALTGVGTLVDAFEATESQRQADAATRIVSDDAPIVHLVNLIVTQGLRDRASDIHIEPQGGRVRVRFRIDGALHDVLALPESMGPALVSRVKIMARMNIVERRRPQDGQMETDVDGRPVDVRVATSPTIWGEKAVLRLLDRNRTLYRLDQLGMPPETYELFSKMLRAPFGMVICGGPTGSGKTTTLYATLGQINQSELNITTIEDPVEYLFSSINQIQINEQAGITFATGLRAILRQDPDVILVGEIRDSETARIAVESALTGHFVLSSIHSTDAASSLQRFVDLGLEAFMIASTVNGIVSQRLVRRVCDQCRAPYEPSIEELAFYESAGGQRPAAGFSQGEGCSFCARTGYLDRIGVFEVLEIEERIKRLLLEGGTTDALRAAARATGMRTLLDGGIRLVEQGVTTIGEIMASVYVR
jgi:type IV pilus assembly protein PilB